MKSIGPPQSRCGNVRVGTTLTDLKGNGHGHPQLDHRIFHHADAAATAALAESDAELDKAVFAVCDWMKADRDNASVTFYYLLAEQYGKLATFSCRSIHSALAVPPSLGPEKRARQGHAMPPRWKSQSPNEPITPRGSRGRRIATPSDDRGKGPGQCDLSGGRIFRALLTLWGLSEPGGQDERTGRGCKWEQSNRIGGRQ